MRSSRAVVVARLPSLAIGIAEDSTAQGKPATPEATQKVGREIGVKSGIEKIKQKVAS